jgi:hypothetical protein
MRGILGAFCLLPLWFDSAGVAPRLRRPGLVLEERTAGGSRGELPGPFEPIQRDLGLAIAAVWALYESTFRDACVMDCTQEEATMGLTARMIRLDRQKRDRR